jgi:hypothetical protein
MVVVPVATVPLLVVPVKVSATTVAIGTYTASLSTIPPVDAMAILSLVIGSRLLIGTMPHLGSGIVIMNGLEHTSDVPWLLQYSNLYSLSDDVLNGTEVVVPVGFTGYGFPFTRMKSVPATFSNTAVPYEEIPTLPSTV